MSDGLEIKQNTFLEYVRKIKYYNDALSILFWDLRTGAPQKGVSERAKVIGMLSAEAFHLSTSDEMEAYINELSKADNYEKLSAMMKALVEECKKDYERFKKIPPEKYKAYVMLTSEAECVWEEAKNTNNFPLFAPYLEKIVQFNIDFINLWGYESNKYNTLLDFYEPGMSVEKLDKIFDQLRGRIVPLVAQVKASPYQPDDAVFKKYFDPREQEAFSLKMLEKMGYDMNAGRLDESEHPFTIGIGTGDVRITTHYYPNLFASALFSSLHEGGHALYEQNICEDLNGTPLCTGTSTGIHESQSRFWENMVGRSYNYWKNNYAELVAVFPEQFEGINLESFYDAINKVEPSLIRVEADELTYNLHVMIRYEIEKALINEKIKVMDLPRVWNEKMQEYLGVVPPDDAQGVLQDVHWAGGSFGYFPSYTLGNIYSAQFYNAMRRDFPDFDGMVSRGELLTIKEWLIENIHKHGKLLTPLEILKSVTGEEIEPKYLVEYLEKKYKEIYRIHA